MNLGEILGKVLCVILNKLLFEGDWCVWCENGFCIGFVGDGSLFKFIIIMLFLDEVVCWFFRDCVDMIVDEVLGIDWVFCVFFWSDGIVILVCIKEVSGRCRIELGRCGGVWWWV